MKGIRVASIALGLAASVASPARASFHLWDVSEAFSNADGSVQYIELFTSASGQEFLHSPSQHSIRTTVGGTTQKQFDFPSNLDTSVHTTQNRFFLLATSGFAAAAGIEPDYVIPDDFIEVGVVDAINFAGVDVFPLDGLPTDGVNALFDGGGVGAPTPTNFAGETGTIVPEPASALLGLAALGALGALRRGAAPRAD